MSGGSEACIAVGAIKTVVTAITPALTMPASYLSSKLMPKSPEF
jgi:hypothetical protein